MISRPIRILGTVLIGVIVFVVAYRAFRPGGGGGGVVRRVLRGQQIIADEQIVVPAGSARMWGFKLPSARPLLVEVLGVAETSKGFSVYLIHASEWKNFKARKKFRHLSTFQGLKVVRYRKAAAVPAGAYCIVIQNSENILNSMTVRIRVVADPD